MKDKNYPLIAQNYNKYVAKALFSMGGFCFLGALVYLFLGEEWIWLTILLQSAGIMSFFIVMLFYFIRDSRSLKSN